MKNKKESHKLTIDGSKLVVGQSTTARSDYSFAVGQSNAKTVNVIGDLVNSTSGAKYVDDIGLAHYTKKLLDKIRKEFYSAPLIEHKCQNCGGTVEWKSDKHIFICPYCKSVYALGTEMINDRG